MAVTIDHDADALPLPTASTSARVPEDQLLRRHGYRILSRPKAGPVLWEKGGETYTHEEAVALVKLSGAAAEAGRRRRECRGR